MTFAGQFALPGPAWRWAMDIIRANGATVLTEDGQRTMEVMNLMVTVENPLMGWPLADSGWDLVGLDEYATQLMNPYAKGFDYDYGNRLKCYPSPKRQDDCWNCSGDAHAGAVDQIDGVINTLKKSPTTRRAIAITWIPNDDLESYYHVPCLQLLDFLIRGEALHCTAFFRSWDVARAGPANMYGLAKLMEHVGQQVGVATGSLTVVAASAHIYEG